MLEKVLMDDRIVFFCLEKLVEVSELVPGSNEVGAIVTGLCEGILSWTQIDGVLPGMQG